MRLFSALILFTLLFRPTPGSAASHPPSSTPARSVLILVDKSRSMAFEGKLEGAKAGITAALGQLAPTDQLGVIGFDLTPFVVIRPAPVSEVREIAATRFANLVASGKTDMLPALQRARELLSQSGIGARLIILVCDGKVPVAGNEYIEEMNRLRAANITLSTVALGVESDVPFMEMLAQYGKGQFCNAVDVTKVGDCLRKVLGDK